MPRNSAGSYVTPSGQPVVAGTVISSTTHNSLVGDLAAEMSDSLSRTGKGGMSAPLRTPNGTVGAPTHSFTNDTDTGAYLAGAGDVRIAAGGVDALAATATGVTVPGTLGVTGAATVGGSLGVTGAATAAGVASSSGVTITDGALTLSNAAFQQIVKAGSGQLEIGTATGNDSTVDLLQNGVVRWRLNSTGDLVAVDGPHALQNVYDPVNAQDAATKAWTQAEIRLGRPTFVVLIDGTTGAVLRVADGSTSGYVFGKGTAGVYTITKAAGYSGIHFAQVTAKATGGVSASWNATSGTVVTLYTSDTNNHDLTVALYD
jgi:hypothetical protein